MNRVVEGLRDGLGDTIGDQLVGLYPSGSPAPGTGQAVSKPAAAAWASRRLGPDQHPDDDGLGATLALVADTVTRARAVR